MLFSVPLPVAWKNLTVLDSLNFIFPLWEPHSRIIFLSQTNELQKVHYVAAPKQEAGVSDGKSWFYIMRDAWGCTYLPVHCRQNPARSVPTNPGALFSFNSHTLRPGWPVSFPRRSAGPHIWQRVYLQRNCADLPALWELTQPWRPFPSILTPHLSTLYVSLGWLCLGTTRGWVQPQRESPMTFYEYHQKKRACPRVQMWVICGQVEGKWHLSCCWYLQAHLSGYSQYFPSNFGSSDHKGPSNRPQESWHFKKLKPPEQPNLSFTLGNMGLAGGGLKK